MKFKKDKEFNFISNSESFNCTRDLNRSYEISNLPEEIEKECLRWEINNYRGYSSYDSPKCENKYGRYVKANYVLTLCYKSERSENVWLTWSNEEWAFETKKEMMSFLNTYMDYINKGEKGEYGYYNNSEFKICQNQK